MNGTATQSHPATTSTAMTGFMPGPHCGRGTLEIIWSCLSTTVLAIWVSLHLEVDSPDVTRVSTRAALRELWKEKFHNFHTRNSKWPLQWRKVFFATYVLILPEPIVTDSIMEFCRALRLKNILVTSGIKGFENFSLRQAFFIVKEGVCVKGDIYSYANLDRACCLTRKSLEEWARTGRLEFADLPSDEQIADRSKSGRVLKTISVFQTLWFIANIIYRVCAGLQVSLLEDLTVAYALCGLLMLIAWFRCPQDVCQPFIIRLRSESDASPRVDMRRQDTSLWLKKRVFHYPLLACLAFSFCAAGFTAIHLAAWKYSFSSVTEQWLWRSCSVAMLPLLGIMFTCRDFTWLEGTIGYSFVLFAITLYIIARLILISLAFAAFRKAPVGIYKDASWTDLIPHI